MPLTKTIEFIPSVFQTETNRKFLNATLDQLVSEPNLQRVNGYVGRKFAPNFTSIESYIKEPTTSRDNYQLEASIFNKNPDSGEVEFHTTYPELIQTIEFLGQQSTNQSAMFANEYYSYNPHINWDAFINFSQYFWLPEGPEPVTITNVLNYSTLTYTVSMGQVGFDFTTNKFNITGENPDITLVRGGTYQFVNTTGTPFYIQTMPGISGFDPAKNNV